MFTINCLHVQRDHLEFHQERPHFKFDCLYPKDDLLILKSHWAEPETRLVQTGMSRFILLNQVKHSIYHVKKSCNMLNRASI